MIKLIVSGLLLLSFQSFAHGDDSQILELMLKAGTPGVCTLGFCVVQVESVTCQSAGSAETAHCEMVGSFNKTIKLSIKEEAAMGFMDLLTASGAVPNCVDTNCSEEVKKIQCSTDAKYNDASCQVEL